MEIVQLVFKAGKRARNGSPPYNAEDLKWLPIHVLRYCQVHGGDWDHFYLKFWRVSDSS
jgi:hypothetical protein